jgi:stage V sporulation protein D (sporulation-specific penicillin-binding protein)
LNNKNQRRVQKIKRKASYQMKKKLVILYGGVLLALVGLMLRITYINATQGDKYKKQVLSQAQSKYQSAVLPAKRGDIYDRNGNVLATSNKVYNLVLDCKAVNDAVEAANEEGESDAQEYISATVKALAQFFDLDEADIQDKITGESTSSSQYQILKTQLSVEEKKAFEEYETIPSENTLSDEEKSARSHITGVWFEEDYLRIYPFNELACDTIGFTLSRDTADIGLEGYYNSSLVGTDGRQYGYVNSDSDVEQTIVEATNGYSIETSLDVGIQQIVEKYVNAFNEAMGAANVGVIVEDPNTGEILAMDGGDRYDLNNPRDLSQVYSEEEIKAMNDAETVDALNSMWSNFCVTEAYEPGSVVKPIVMASALEKGSISTSDTFVCDGGQQFGTDTFIRCAVYPDSHGTETLADVIANSCNDGMMQIAAKLGTEQFIKAQSLFNFGSRTGIDLPNEGYGIIHTTETMGVTELACSGFGQGFTVTMIQEINAMCSVVNGGYYYQPHLVTKIKDSDGNVVKTISPTLLKQTISSTISENMRSYMQASVERGTSMTSKVNGYSSGGKTGTAEKYPRDNGKYLVSFIGFAPADDPQIVIYVVVDEPNAEDQATSSYPQYIAQGILSELLPYLNILPDETTDGYVEDTELWEGFKGHLQSVSDSEVDEDGNLVDGDGNLIDFDGNRVDEQGYLLDDDGNRKLDEDGEYILSDSLDSFSDESTMLPEATANSNMPGPLESDEDPIQGNDMESEGVTNEEAGFD